MNIQSTNINLYNTLEKLKLEEFTFGSHLFGLNDENSDEDKFIIMAQSNSFANSFLWASNNIQFKTENEDKLYSTLQNFLVNIFNGEATYNFELIHDEQVKNSSLKFLYDMRQDFYSYNIIKAYIGLAKRDLKYAIHNGKRFSHAIRGLVSAEMLLYHGMYTNDIKSFDSKAYELMWLLKHDEYDSDLWKLLDFYKDKLNQIRNDLNNAFNNGKIVRYMKVERMNYLNELVQSYSNSEEYLSKVHNTVDLELYFDALENGIQY